MGFQLKSAVAGAAAVGMTVGVGVIGLGLLDNAAAEPGKPRAPKAGDAYTFVDKDLTPNLQDAGYILPKLPAGPYAVSIFAGLEPKVEVPDENLYCQVSDTTKPHRTVVVTAHWRDSAATFVSGASALRVTDESDLRVACSAEHGEFTYSSDPLRVTFVRLASWKVTSISPQ